MDVRLWWHRAGWGSALIVLWGLVGCSEEPAPLVKADPGLVPAYEQRPGDPERGYWAMVNEDYVSCGIPRQAYEQTAEPVAAELKLPGRDPQSADLPYMLTGTTNADGVDLVVSNCLACHASTFNGELVVGLGNETMDWTEDLALMAEGVGNYVTGEAEAAAWRKWADRMSAIAPYTMTDTVGVNPANNLTYALISHRDPETLAWSEEPLIDSPRERPLPVSVPPWWRMKKKHALFYSAQGRGDHARFMMTAAIFCTDDLEEAQEIDRYAADMRAWISSLEAPAYPFPINDSLAAEGQQVFDKVCSACHGRYGEKETYPNLLVDLSTIGTDPALAEEAYDGTEPYMRWYAESFFGEKAIAEPAKGYVAPPLDGVWATAPFLHNGSVPTIRSLLNSETRPDYWTWSGDSDDFDQDNLGWEFTALDYGKKGARDWQEEKRIYDTTLPGYGNQGHRFGDALSEAERDAVLEYLKTL